MASDRIMSGMWDNRSMFMYDNNSTAGLHSGGHSSSWYNISTAGVGDGGLHNNASESGEEDGGGWLPPTVSHNTMALVMWYIHLYCTPAIIGIGLVGNCLSFLVFMCTSQKHLSSSVYLAALAVVDSLFLFQLLLLWPTYLRIFLVHKPFLCQLIIYLSYVTSFLSVWLVVAFTVERFIVCTYPLRRISLCTTARAKAVTVSLSIFAAVAYSYNTWTSTVITNAHHHRECIIREQFRYLVDIISLIDSLITFVLPVFGIIIMNMKIIYKVMYFDNREFSTLSRPLVQANISVSSSNSWSSASVSGQNRHQRAHSSSQMKVTKMLLVVSTMFLILNLPSHAIRVYDTFQTFFNPNYRRSSELHLWQQIFTFLFNCNFSVNFFLYSLCGTSFRKALSSMMRNAWNKMCQYLARQCCDCAEQFTVQVQKSNNSLVRATAVETEMNFVTAHHTADTEVTNV